jgi:hypothetical protein
MGIEKSAFEAKTCGRCGGSGHYSYNQMHGSTCYGCSGRGYILTKRGAAAANFFRASLCKKGDAVELGDKIDTGSGAWEAVEEITRDDKYVTLITARSRNSVFAHTDVRVQHTVGARREKLAAALAYQATLDARGNAKVAR